MARMKTQEEDRDATCTCTPPTTNESKKTEEKKEEKEEILLSTEASLRQLIRERLPMAESPPSYVRHWFAGYFTYRGVDPRLAGHFLWSGAELQDLALVELADAFRAKLRMAPPPASTPMLGTAGSEAEAGKGVRKGGCPCVRDTCRKNHGDGGAASVVITPGRTSAVTEAEVEMLAADVFNFVQVRLCRFLLLSLFLFHSFLSTLRLTRILITYLLTPRHTQQSSRPFLSRTLARARRLVSTQATMVERLDALLTLAAYLVMIFLMLASLAGLWAYKGLDETVVGMLQRIQMWLEQVVEAWAKNIANTWWW
ncbi:hypothetical protein PG999_003263 [Apiospora kogelbergensis]|uniref:Uncharacterized protein n=1 Tax=Apiospora kogelbergensis TaxID=1337665 RepID=A0AAW0R304_9PEZI